MALSDEIREQRQHLKGKGRKAYIQYFLDYYKYPVLIALAVLIFITSLVVHYVTRKEPVLRAVLLNGSDLTGEESAALAEAFYTYAGLDPRKGEAVFETALYETPGSTLTSADLASSTRMDVLLAAGEMDLLCADAWNFRRYASAGAVRDLRDVLDSSQLTQLEGRLYYVDLADEAFFAADPENETEAFVTVKEAEAFENRETFVLPDPAGMKDPAPVGIVETGPSMEAFYGDTVCVFGFPWNSGNEENAKQFMAFLEERDGSL